jgi:predicted oxidoreductase
LEPTHFPRGGFYSFGGQAWWSFGGLFLVNSPEQRRMGIKDSKDLAWQDWMGSAGFDKVDDEDYWGRKWAEAYWILLLRRNVHGCTVWVYAFFQS